MLPHEYQFHFEEAIEAAPADVAELLRSPERLADWCPEACTFARKRLDGSVELHLRGFLPHIVRVVMNWNEVQQDEVFEAATSGDVVGMGRWTVSPIDGGARMKIQQHLTANTLLLRVMSWIARPLCVANHCCVMRRILQAMQRELSASAERNRQSQALAQPGVALY